MNLEIIHLREDMDRYLFAKNMSKNIAKNVSKNLSAKYSQKLIDHATDAFKIDLKTANWKKSRSKL